MQWKWKAWLQTPGQHSQQFEEQCQQEKSQSLDVAQESKADFEDTGGTYPKPQCTRHWLHLLDLLGIQYL
jgi:hypothetical protein